MTMNKSLDINPDINHNMHPNFVDYNTDISDSESNIDSNSDLSHVKSAFDQTTENLFRLGSISLDRFRSLAMNQDDDLNNDDFDNGGNDDNHAENSLENMDVDTPFVLGHSFGEGGGSQPDIDIASVVPGDAPKILRDLARRFFGNSKSAVRAEPIKYEILEDKAPTMTTSAAAVPSPKYSCILTIFRPTGSSRSYRTKPDFSKRSEAKAAAAHLALRLGALEFMKNGDKTRDRVHLVPLGRLGSSAGGTGGSKPPDGNSEFEERDSSGDVAILEIESCCTEWRSGTVNPQWTYLTDSRFIGSFGCALKISLSTHVQRAYSIIPGNCGEGHVNSYPTKSHAKSACAKLAIKEGVLEFIKHGDGLEHPVSGSLVMDRGEHLNSSGGVPFAPAATVLTLQAFYESLPKPMPDLIGTKLNGDFNAIPWLNNMIQITKGSRMSSSFHWFTDAKVGLYGCLLRLTRPDGPSKTYMVDAVFSKRSDAKVAVCLWACSQGLGTYVRQVSTEIDSLVTPQMRKRCAEELLPSLGHALHKIRAGIRADFGFVCDLASFNCVLTIDLSTIVDTTNTSTNDISPVAAMNSSGSPSTPESSGANINEEDTQDLSLDTSHTPPAAAISLPSSLPSNKTWITRTKFLYRNKQDAKVAAVCLAFEEGIMKWVEGYQGQGLSCGHGSLGEGKLTTMPRFSSRKFEFGTSRGMGFGGRGRGRGGFERGRRGQCFGRGPGEGRGKSGFFGGYAHAHTQTKGRGNGSGSGFGAESGRVVANSTNIELDTDATMMTPHAEDERMELEDGEMVDGETRERAVGTSTKGNTVAYGNGTFRGRGKREVRVRAPRGGPGFKSGRGRVSTVVHPIRPTQYTQQPSKVAPHINPRFFPHINGIPASSIPSYQPPVPQPPPSMQGQHPLPPPEYEYDAYAYDYVPASGSSVQPGYDYNHKPLHSGWYGEDEFISSSEEYQQYLYQSKAGHDHVHPRHSRALDRPQIFHYQVQENGSSLHSGKGVTQQRPTTPTSAHYKRQLDAADAASNAVSEPQLVLASMDADKGGVGLGDESDSRDGKGEVIRAINKEKTEETGKGKGNVKSGDGVIDRNESDLRRVVTNGKKQISETESMTTAGRVPSGFIPSGPRAVRNRAPKLGTDTMVPQQYYPPEYDYPTSSVAGYQTGQYQYPYPFQQIPPPPPLFQSPYQPYDDNYDSYYLPDTSSSQVPVFTYPGYPAGHYPSTHLHQGYPPPQPDAYIYPTHYASQTIVEPNAPPVGPRAMLLSRKQLPVVQASGPQNEGRQPPSAPRAMMQKASQQFQKAKPSLGKRSRPVNETMDHFNKKDLPSQGLEHVKKRAKVQA